jgi:4-alpha-glucanotransferase
LPSFDHLLDRATALFGINSGYWDIWGRHHDTPVETRQTILRALGVDAKSTEGLEYSLAELDRHEWTRLLPPVVVTSDKAPVELVLNVAESALGQAAHITLQQENGRTSQWDVRVGALPIVASANICGTAMVRVRATLHAHPPLGYHELRVSLGGNEAVTRYIVTPDRAWSDPHLAGGGKAAGVSVSLYGVRSERNWGCGDFRDLDAVIDWAAGDLGASFVGLNPLHAIHNRRPFNTSPYLPISIFYQNFIYLDVESLPDFQRCRRARELRARPEIEGEIAELRAAPFVEYERVSALKLRFLKLCFAQFLRDRRSPEECSEESRHGGPKARATDFDEYREREGDLLARFSAYCALDEVLHRCNPDLWVWTDWPEEFRDPDSPAVSEFSRKHWRRVLFYQYVQWQIDTQLRVAQQHARERGLSIGLYHDLALATDRFGSDFWGYREFFVAGCRVGSPPDDFSPKGQDWAFPPPNALRHREDGYRLFAESIRKNCRHGGALRIDHVMRLFRLFWIPDGSDATTGAYVRELNEDLVRILALESVRNQVTVIGEDLGTVEDAVRDSLASFRILSYRLLYFEKDGAEFKPYDQYPPQALVSSTTHDLATLAGFWAGADIEARKAAGLIDDDSMRRQWEGRRQEKQKMLDVLFGLDMMPRDHPRHADAYGELTPELHNAVVGFLARTPSALLAINQEDLTKEMHQQNLPGSTWQYPNWGRKMRFTVEELRSGEAAGYTRMFADWIERTGRKTATL